MAPWGGWNMGRRLCVLQPLCVNASWRQETHTVLGGNQDWGPAMRTMQANCSGLG